MRLLCATAFMLCVFGEIGLCVWWYWFEKDGLEPLAVIVGIIGGGFAWGYRWLSRTANQTESARDSGRPETNVISELRKILKERYDDGRLSDLLQDYFNDVYRDQSSQPRDAKIRALLEWCQSHDKLDHLKTLLDAGGN